MLALAVVAPAAGTLAGCALGPSAAVDTGGRIDVVATISAWGSILAQLGGDRVQPRSIISNPNVDPHDYEPTPADGRTIATARLLVTNGIGYDGWAARVAAANPDRHRRDLDVGKLVGVRPGGNPHRWYAPTDVMRVADAMTADLKAIDPADAAYFDARRNAFETRSLAPYRSLVDEIRSAYGGTAIGASESVVVPLADALGLRLLTPQRFLDAVSEGADPSAADKSAIDRQIAGREITVYVFNRQNSTPDVAAQVKAARARGIPVVPITEMLSPSTASFQDWQVVQLQALQAALRQAVGR